MGYLAHDSCSRLLFDKFRSGHVVHSPTHRRCWVTCYTVQLLGDVGSRGTQSNSQMVSGHMVQSNSQMVWVTWYIVQLPDGVGSRGTQSNPQMVSGHMVQSNSQMVWVTWYIVQLPDGVGSRGTQSDSQAVSSHAVHSPMKDGTTCSALFEPLSCVG